MINEQLDIIFIPNFLNSNDATLLFKTIDNDIFKEDETYQKTNESKMPRLIKWYGEKAYAYSSIFHPAKVIPDYINIELTKINNFLSDNKINSKLNSVLINYYRDGKDKINYHSDDETQIGSEPVIVSLSLGDSRIFIFKNKNTKEKKIFELKNGDLIIMKGKTQEYWQHAILSENNKQARINLTFRNTKYDPILK